MRTLGFYLCLAGALSWAVPCLSQAGELPSPRTLLDRSISYHDPNGVWQQGAIRIDMEVTYSSELASQRGVRGSRDSLWLSPARETFRFVRRIGDDVVEYTVDHGTGGVSVNESTEISADDRERLRLAEPELYRDYFEYLFGMPMKLLDSGTKLDPEVKAAKFDGRPAWALRVSYDPEVGEDIWYFYFDVESSALVGYRFFHDESKNDGEYIVFTGEVHDEATGLRLPRTRTWYYNADDGYLATDEIVLMSVEMARE